MDPSWLWIPFTLIAAGGQVARNVMQRGLTAELGTVGATHVRFLFGFPFALVFLAGVLVVSGQALPAPPAVFWPWVLAGAFMQIVATALMLAVMNRRSFVVTTAYLKTEPIQVAVFGFVFLGDLLSPMMIAAIGIATAGVFAMSFRASRSSAAGSVTPTLLGLLAGGLFAMSAVGFRGAILTLGDVGFVMAATFTLAVGLVLQATLLSAYLLVRSPQVLRAIAGAWRPSLLAGFTGAAASQFWFLAFALATAASVRTLALVEVLFAQAMSLLVFKQRTSLREALGIVMVVVGVLLLIRAH